MHSSSTPFKIHDENESFNTKTMIKGSRLGGLNNNNMADTTLNNHAVHKKNILLNSEIKTNRKALSNLSTSQVNIRSAVQINNTPLIQNNDYIHTNKTLKFHPEITKKNNPGINILNNGIKKTYSNSSIIVLNNLINTVNDNNKIENDFLEEDMLCSHITDNEDPYDIVLKLSQNSLNNALTDIDLETIHYELSQSNNNDSSSNEYCKWNDDLELISNLQESINVQYFYDILLSNQDTSIETELKLMDLNDL